MARKMGRGRHIRRINERIWSIQFVNMDLNLLRVFDALITEGSVSRAATRLKLSQPATSNALARLREALKDPLLVRTRDGMVPTPRALALHGTVAATLKQFSEALQPPRPFDPSTDRRTFVITASDHAQLIVLPELMKRLARFPGLRLRVLAPPRDFPLRELETGEVDLVLGIFGLAPGDAPPQGLKRQVLAREKFVVVARRKHPAFRGPRAKLDLTMPQLHVSPRGGTEGRFERKTKLRRNIVAFLPHYLVAPWVLASSDVIAALPERVAARFVEHFPLELHPSPIPHDALDVVQLWHPLRQADGAHQWLREQVAQSANPLRE
ncbi:MAG: LysR family transcriptional regulator [Archangium sp.]